MLIYHPVTVLCLGVATQHLSSISYRPQIETQNFPKKVPQYTVITAFINNTPIGTPVATLITITKVG
jgi:hypothetical protein